MKKAVKIIYSALFFGICCVPLAALPFVKSNAEIEKKELAKMPALIKKGTLNTGFSEEFESWFSDNLPYRSEMLSGANLLKSEIFSTPSANVITGKDGWLFFQSTTSDYMDTNPMTDKELQSIVTTLSLLQEYTEAQEGHFLFVPAPNKNSIYSEYMPDFYTKAETNNLDRLYKKLENSEVNYVNLKEVLTENKAQGLYHKRDTHWNYLGAYYGYNTIMTGLEKDHKTYDGVDYTITNTWRGDLDKLLYPSGGFMDKQYNFDIEYDEFRFTMPARVTDTKAQLENFMSDKEDNDNRFRTAKLTPTGSGNLYMVRDSYGRALLPFMIDNYDTAMFVRTTCPEMTMVTNGTDMVYEIVERNLPNLVRTAPFMMAPDRTNTPEVEVKKTVASDQNLVYTSDEAYGYRVYGTMSSELLSEDARVYVCIENDKEKYVLEAFPIYEEKLLENETTSSHTGFSLMLDKTKIKEGNYKVSLISGHTSSGVLTEISV